VGQYNLLKIWAAFIRDMVREPCLPLSYPLRPPTKVSTRVKGHVPYVPKVSHPATSPDSQTLHKHLLISNDQLQQTH